MEQGAGIVTLRSHHSVPETIGRLRRILQDKGIQIFALIDHSGEAEKIHLSMPPAQVLIFGNPAGGTPVMLAAPTAAIDLPLKALAWQDADGAVWLTYNHPDFLKRRFGVADDLMNKLAAVSALIEQAAGE